LIEHFIELAKLTPDILSSNRKRRDFKLCNASTKFSCAAHVQADIEAGGVSGFLARLRVKIGWLSPILHFSKKPWGDNHLPSGIRRSGHSIHPCISSQTDVRPSKKFSPGIAGPGEKSDARLQL
jgi:hypothetical protein